MCKDEFFLPFGPMSKTYDLFGVLLQSVVITSQFNPVRDTC